MKYISYPKIRIRRDHKYLIIEIGTNSSGLELVMTLASVCSIPDIRREANPRIIYYSSYDTEFDK